MILLFKSSDHKFSNFKAKEFECPCCGYALIDTELLIVLERIRLVAQKPIHINSGYRCPKHNEAVGGKPLSTHLAGFAADITWQTAELDLSDAPFRMGVTNLKWDTKIMGIGFAKTWMHVDTDQSRKHLTTWTY